MTCPRKQELIQLYSSAAGALNRSVAMMNTAVTENAYGAAFRNARSDFREHQRDASDARADLEAHERKYRCK